MILNSFQKSLAKILFQQKPLLFSTTAICFEKVRSIFCSSSQNQMQKQLPHNCIVANKVLIQGLWSPFRDPGLHLGTQVPIQGPISRLKIPIWGIRPPFGDPVSILEPNSLRGPPVRSQFYSKLGPFLVPNLVCCSVTKIQETPVCLQMCRFHVFE